MPDRGCPQTRSARWRRRAKSRHRATCRPRLFGRGGGDRVGAWARRAEQPRRIVIIGPAHRVAFQGIAVHPASKWRTSLGEIPVAAAAGAQLAQAPGVAVHARPFAGEHSLEMHLIMLQAMLPAPFEIVPILVGDADPHIVAEALRRVWGGPETVVAVSSDLSHFLDQRSATSIDTDTMRRIETLDAAALDGRRACGFLPIKGALEIAAERDMRASGLHLATSADVGADASGSSATAPLARIRGLCAACRG